MLSTNEINDSIFEAYNQDAISKEEAHALLEYAENKYEPYTESMTSLNTKLNALKVKNEMKKADKAEASANKAADKIRKNIEVMKADKKILIAKLAKANADNNKLQSAYYSNKIEKMSKEIKKNMDKLKTVDKELPDNSDDE